MATTGEKTPEEQAQLLKDFELREKEYELRKQELKLKEQAQLYDKWHKYESIAMHFNDLIIRFRTQALAGLAALSTLVVFMLGDKVNLQDRPFALFLLALFILISWGVIWVLDGWYYQELLLGSVAAILELEEKSNGDLNMSTKIEERLNNDEKGKPPWAPKVYYATILIFLLCVTIFSGCYAWQNHGKQPDAKQLDDAPKLKKDL